MVRPARSIRTKYWGRTGNFGDSADKAASFLWLCDAFNVPLLFLSDVPGFMVGTTVRA